MSPTSSAALTEAEQVYDLLLGFFEGDASKARQWLRSVNTLLGGVPPAQVLRDSPGKLLKFVTACLAENKR